MLAWAPPVGAAASAAPSGVVEPLLADVDAHDPVAEGVQELHGVVAEAAGGAEHGDGAAGDHPVVEELLHRAVGGEPAAGERGLLVAECVGDDDEPGCVDDELLGEGAHDPAGPGAVAGPAGEAELARPAPVGAAGAAEPEDHPVADRDPAVGPGPEGLDHADGLVAEHPLAVGADPGPVAPGEVEVGVAHARGGDAHADLGLSRLGHVTVDDRDLTVDESCCLHVGPPSDQGRR